MEKTDRIILEEAEARVLVDGFAYNGQSQDWLKKALAVSRRTFGAGSEDRIRGYMREFWKETAFMRTKE